jgi:hypothetical protein
MSSQFVYPAGVLRSGPVEIGIVPRKVRSQLRLACGQFRDGGLLLGSVLTGLGELDTNLEPIGSTSISARHG